MARMVIYSCRDYRTMKKETYVCEHCGAERKESNHWFVLIVHTEFIEIRPFFPWRHWSTARHYCGESCLQAAVSRAPSNGFGHSAGEKQHEPSGINRFFGKWPSEETDGELRAMLRQVRGSEQ